MLWRFRIPAPPAHLSPERNQRSSVRQLCSAARHWQRYRAGCGTEWHTVHLRCGQQAGRLLEPDHRSIRCYPCHSGERHQGSRGTRRRLSSNLYVADSTLNEVLIFSPAGAISTIAPPNVTAAVGVAVDPSGSVLVADAGTGNIVRVPDLSGTLTTASAITIETVAPKASSLSMDSQGDVYVASASGKAAYAIQRSAAAVNLGTVSDGVTNSATVTS